METMTEAIESDPPRRLRARGARGHHSARGRRLDRPSSGQGCRGRRARRPQGRPPPASPAGGEVPPVHHQEPGGRRVHPPQRRARAGRRRQAALAGGGVRRRPPGPQREVPVRLPLPAPLHPRGPREDRGEDARDRRRGERVRARRGHPRGGRADLPRARRDPEGRAAQGHPRGGDDHPLQGRPVHRPLPRVRTRRTCRRSAPSGCSRRPPSTSRGTRRTSACSASTAPPS